jgi:hypothetical protein
VKLAFVLEGTDNVVEIVCSRVFVVPSRHPETNEDHVIIVAPTVDGWAATCTCFGYRSWGRCWASTSLVTDLEQRCVKDGASDGPG